MGYGTGVLRAYYGYYSLRGLTVGIAGTASLFVARRAGVQQNLLIAARGFGLILGPLTTSRAIGKTVWCGEAQVGVAAALLLKGLFALAIPQASSPYVLYTAFFMIGLAMSVLDTMSLFLVTSVVKGSGSTMLSLYDVCYGIGGMVAPFLTVAMPDSCWNVLAVLDFLIAGSLLGRRFTRGKPRDWKTKLRRVGSSGPSGSYPMCSAVVPARILRAGIAFTFVSQIASTSVSAWGFTFASQHLGLPDTIAALIPSTFYLASTVARFGITGVSMRLIPSAIIWMSLLFFVSGALLFHTLAGIISATARDLETYILLIGVALMGVGVCPHHSFMLVAMAQHGDLHPREHGWYTAGTSLGATSGMVLPSLVSLPNVEVASAIALALILNSRIRDFPWRDQFKLES
mmetsp:Transcript_99006/g.255964  ORF Transcript_99006/g.255964 Transcript_99006/m.255964 type:complete len:402 (+) Transcript_99006:68-1273(+)